MEPLFIIGGLVAVAAVLTIAALRGRGSSQSIEDRLNELAASGQSVTLEELELSQPFSQRVLIPMFEALAKVAQRFTPQNSLETVRHQLMLAGISHKLKPAQFLAYRIGGALVLGVLAVLVVLSSVMPFMQRLLIIGVGFVLGYLLPGRGLGRRSRNVRTRSPRPCLTRLTF